MSVLPCKFCILLAFIVTLKLYAQVPDSDIWLFKVKTSKGISQLTNPRNITARKGYDNQPALTNDLKSIYYVSIRDDNQADIYSYNLKSGKHANLTNSKTSEYSPTIMPNGIGFTAVVVEEDSVQRIWSFNIDGSFKNIVCANTDSVGYHTWINLDTLLYYKLTEPHSLRSLNVKTQKDTWICNDPARSFKKIDNSNKFIYSVKRDSTMDFRIYDPVLKESKIYASYPSIKEDFIWNNSKGLIKSEGSNLLYYNSATEKWEILFSLGDFGITDITRFLIDEKTKQVIIVNNLHKP